jgi:hypothetical protein
MKFSGDKQMEPTLDNKFSKDFEVLRLKIELLKKTFKDGVQDLPDDLNCPENESDSHTVKWFSEKIYSLGCDIAELGESMMVSKEVSNSYEDHLLEKEGAREFEGYQVGE